MPNTPPKPFRAQSQTDRDLAGMQAKRDRERMQTQRERDAAPGESFDDITEKYEGEELRAARALRPMGKRIEKLEDKHDALAKAFQSTQIAIVRIDANQQSMTKVMEERTDAIRESIEMLSKVQHMKFTAELDYDKTRATAEATAQIDVAKAKELDEVEKKKDRRKFWLTVAGGLAGGGALFKILHAFGVL